MFESEEFRSEEVMDIDYDRAVEAAGTSSVWSEFYEDSRARRWTAVAVAATAALAVGVSVWFLARRMR